MGKKDVYLFLDAITDEGTTNIKVKIPKHEGGDVKAEQLERISLEMAGFKDHSRAAKWDLKKNKTLLLKGTC